MMHAQCWQWHQWVNQRNRPFVSNYTLIASLSLLFHNLRLQILVLNENVFCCPQTEPFLGIPFWVHFYVNTQKWIWENYKLHIFDYIDYSTLYWKIFTVFIWWTFSSFLWRIFYLPPKYIDATINKSYDVHW